MRTSNKWMVGTLVAAMSFFTLVLTVGPIGKHHMNLWLGGFGGTLLAMFGCAWRSSVWERREREEEQVRRDKAFAAAAAAAAELSRAAQARYEEFARAVKVDLQQKFPDAYKWLHDHPTASFGVFYKNEEK